MKVFDVESRVTCATFPLVKEHPLPSFSCKRDIVRDREGDGAEEKGEMARAQLMAKMLLQPGCRSYVL